MARIISDQTGAEIVGSGSIARQIAAEKNLTVTQLFESVDSLEIDRMIDDTTREKGKENTPLIVDSRLAWHFIPDSRKLFLTVDPQIAAQRIFDDNRSTEINNSVEETKQNNSVRTKNDQERFKKLYSVDFLDWANFDMIVDSSYVSPEFLAEFVLNHFEKDGIWISPKRLIPTKSIQETTNSDSEKPAQQSETAADLNQTTIDVVEHDGQFFIWDGHKQALSALRTGYPQLIQVRVIDEAELQTLSPGLTPAKFAESVNHSWQLD